MSTTTNLGLYKHDNVDSNENEFDIEKALNENWDKIDEKVGNIATEIDAKADIINITTGKIIKTGRIYNGKEEYMKEIYIDGLPNTETKLVSMGIPYTTITIHKIEGCADDGSGYSTIPLPYATNSDSSVVIGQVGNNIRIITNDNRSAFVNATVTIYFTYNN